MKVSKVPSLSANVKKEMLKNTSEFSKELAIAITKVSNKFHVSFVTGMRIVCKFKGLRLYSSGLEPDEYIEYIPGKGVCYEDGCVIGESCLDAVELLRSLGWVDHARFYIDLDKPLPDGVTIDDIQKFIEKIEKC